MWWSKGNVVVLSRSDSTPSRPRQLGVGLWLLSLLQLISSRGHLFRVIVYYSISEQSAGLYITKRSEWQAGRSAPDLRGQCRTIESLMNQKRLSKK